MRVKRYTKNAPKVAVLAVVAVWCPHCQALKPELDRAASILGNVVPIYEVDSERDADVVRALGVKGFPTIFFRDGRGKLTEYTGERKGRAIADWACSKSGMCGGRA